LHIQICKYAFLVLPQCKYGPKTLNQSEFWLLSHSVAPCWLQVSGRILEEFGTLERKSRWIKYMHIIVRRKIWNPWFCSPSTFVSRDMSQNAQSCAIFVSAIKWDSRKYSLATGMVIGNILNSNSNSNYFFTLFRIPIRIAIVFPRDFEFQFQLIGLIVNYFEFEFEFRLFFFCFGMSGNSFFEKIFRKFFFEDISISMCWKPLYGNSNY
jgi:hypothetical protein